MEIERTMARVGFLGAIDCFNWSDWGEKGFQIENHGMIVSQNLTKLKVEGVWDF